jgi:hypothetical protein
MHSGGPCSAPDRQAWDDRRMSVRTFDEHALGLSWVAEDYLSRAAHALIVDGKVWFVDPFECDDAIERGAALGEPAGVLQLYFDHDRASAAVAERFGVPHHKLVDTIPDAPFSLIPLSFGPVWKEYAVWLPEPRGLVVMESIGTGHLYRLGSGPAGVHPLRRLFPPNALRTFRPEHLLVGHGAPLHGGDAAAGLIDALERSRRDLPRMVLRPQDFVRGALARR